jgi:type II secretory pathway pseudopilin PulG
MHKKQNSGFVLIELVTTLILIGFIGAFAGLFIYTGVTGFLASKRNSETALKAQVVLDRISFELRNIESIQEPPVQSPKPNLPPNPNASITYRSKGFGDANWRISYESGNQRILLRAPDKPPPGYVLTDYELLDNVDRFTLYVDADNNLDGSLDGSKEVSAIKIDFGIKDVGTTFSVRIYPRNFITKTW